MVISANNAAGTTDAIAYGKQARTQPGTTPDDVLKDTKSKTAEKTEAYEGGLFTRYPDFGSSSLSITSTPV